MKNKETEERSSANEPENLSPKEKLYAEQVKLLYAQAPLSMIATAANSVILAVILWNVVSHKALIIWLALSLLLVLFRYQPVRAYQRMHPQSVRTELWAVLFLLGLAASGIVMGSVGIFLFPSDHFPHQVFLVFLLGGTVAGATGAYSMRMEAFWVYSLPTVTPTIVNLLSRESKIQVAMGGMLILFFFIMQVTAFRLYKTTESSLKLRFENSDLIARLTAEKERAEGIVEVLSCEITEHQETEEALQEREQEFRNLVETMNEGLGVQDENGVITYVNDKLCEMLGYSRDQLIGRFAADFLDESGRRIFEKAIAQRRLRKRTSYEIELLTKNNHKIPVFISGSPILDKQGRFKGVMAVITDITVLKQAKQELQDQLHFLQTLIDTIPNPIFYKDTQGRYIGCNKAFENRLGLKKEEIVGKFAHEILPENLAAKYHEMDLVLFREGGEQIDESSLIYADGEKHDVILNRAVFTNHEGEVAGLVGVTVDITERKRAEEALRKAHDDLEIRVAERTAELARANEDLRNEIVERRRAEDAVRDSAEKLKLFAYSVAHDLKSPVVGVYGLTRLLHQQYRDILDEKGKKYCDQILKTSEHVADLVEKINAYATTKESPMTFETVNVEEILRIIHDEFSAKMSLRQVDWFKPEVLPEIRADRLSMLRMFRNLVDNALKYGGEKLSEIRIGYEASGDFHVFSVKDNGVGVKQEDSEKIFKVFHRRSTSKGIEGTGLGLAIVKEIAERHQGRVGVESGPEGGTTFFVYISKHL